MKPQYKYLIIVLVAFALGFLIKWYFTPTGVSDDVERLKTQQKELQARHLADSTTFVHTKDSLISVLEYLNKRITVKDMALVKIADKYKRERERIKLLPAEESVALYNLSVNDTAKVVVIDSDTLMLGTIPGVKTANFLFSTLEEADEVNTILKDKVTIMDSVIAAQVSYIDLQAGQITELTKDYYDSRKINKDQAEIVDKLRRKIRVKNAIIGVTIGVAAVGIGAAIIR